MERIHIGYVLEKPRFSGYEKPEFLFNYFEACYPNPKEEREEQEQEQEQNKPEKKN
jgi:ABC-type multidrug transport system ATPase subunit